MQIVVVCDYSKISTVPSDETLHEYEFSAGESDLDLASGIMFLAWSYNGGYVVVFSTNLPCPKHQD